MYTGHRKISQRRLCLIVVLCCIMMGLEYYVIYILYTDPRSYLIVTRQQDIRSLATDRLAHSYFTTSEISGNKDYTVPLVDDMENDIKVKQNKDVPENGDKRRIKTEVDTNGGNVFEKAKKRQKDANMQNDSLILTALRAH